MPTSSRVTFAALAASLSMPLSGVRLLAQDRDDAHWLDDCRRQSEWNSRTRYCDLRVQHLSASIGRVSVDAGENGSIEIAGSDGDSVVVHELVRTEGTSDDDARALASQVQVVTTGSVIHADGPATRHRESWSVSYRITVPKRFDVTLTATNGPLSIDGVTGHLQLDAVNGPIELDGIGGDVHARAENGPLEIRLSGAGWNGTGLDAETENGPVHLSVPEHYAAHLETSTVNGPMHIDFPVTLEGRIDARRLAIDLDGGGPTVRVATTNGPVDLRKD
jgi:Putative adhesin